MRIAGVDHLVGSTDAATKAAHIEAGYHMGNFTPFAGLRVKSMTADGYSESATSGTSSYALQYGDKTTTSLRSELGVEMQWPKVKTVGSAMSFGVRAAWAHELSSNTSGQTSFVTMPGTDITVSGATRDKDSMLLSANAGWTSNDGIYVSAAVDAEYSKNSRDYGGSITVGIRW